MMEEPLGAITAMLRCDGPVARKTDWFEYLPWVAAQGDQRALVAAHGDHLGEANVRVRGGARVRRAQLWQWRCGRHDDLHQG